MNRVLKWFALIPKVFEKLWSHGVAGTFGMMSRRIRDKYRDWKLGIDTTGFVHRSKLGGNPSGRDYVATDYRCLDRLFENVDVDDDVLVEYGCGKGRVLIFAGMRPFRRIIGVEHAEGLCAMAQQNVERTADKLACQNIEVIHADAANYELPDDATMVFMFNPFGEDVLDVVAEQMQQSLHKSPRRFRLVYVFPTGRADYFAGLDLLQTSEEIPTGGWNKFRMRVYEHRPSEVAISE